MAAKHHPETTKSGVRIANPKRLAAIRSEINKASYVYLGFDITEPQTNNPLALLKITKTQARDLLNEHPDAFAAQVQTLYADSDWPRTAVMLFSVSRWAGEITPTKGVTREDFLGMVVDSYTVMPHAR